MTVLMGFGIWIASVALAGSIGWLIGDSGRFAGLIDGQQNTHDLPDEQGAGGFFTLAIASHSLAAEAANRPVEAQAEAAPTDPWKLTRRRDNFINMPPIDEVRAQAQAIRLSGKVWQSPDPKKSSVEQLLDLDYNALDILRGYRASIDEITCIHGDFPSAAERREMRRSRGAREATGTNPGVLAWSREREHAVSHGRAAV